MSKVIALWRNELARIVKRPFILVVTIIMAVLCFGMTGLMKFTSIMASSMVGEISDYGDTFSDEAMIDEQLRYYKEQTQALQAELEGAQTGSDEYRMLVEELQFAGTEYEYYTVLKENGLPMYSSTHDFLDHAARVIAEEKMQLQYGSPDKDEQTLKTERICAYEDIVKNKDYGAYIDLQKEELKLGDYSEEERAIYEKALDYQLLCSPTGEVSAVQEVESWRNDKLSLLQNQYYSDGVYLPLTDKLKEDLENNIAVYEYKIENGLTKVGSDEDMIAELSITAAGGICNSFLLFVLIILAGGCISTDIQTGAIKGLIIAPVKRSKIFFAKILSLLTVGLVGTLICAGVTLAAQCAFFGFSSISPYVYAFSGKAHELPGVLYLIAQMLVWLIPVLLIAAFAIMLSAVTRNTGVAIGVSIAAYFVSSGAMSFISMGILKGEWVKFLPFQHMDLTAAFFPYSITSQILDAAGFTTGPSLLFSLVYLGVLILCLGYIAFDSFTRRDM